MNDLPQNELFSAYLDGELTAAEQAKMERLLATSPAARRLLDELRSLSHTLQALPQEKLGEDLSRQVLRVAERRMLTEGTPGDAETAPMPLEKSIFHRFVNRRTMVWLGLTAAIAVMITINERRQGVRPAADGAREVALAPAGSTKLAKKPGPPPSIQAAHDAPVPVLKEAESPVEKKSAAAAPAAESPAGGFSAKVAAEPPASSSPAKLAAKPSAGGFADKVAGEKPADRSRSVAKSLPREDSMAPAAPTPAETAPAGSPSSTVRSEPLRAKDGRVAGKASGGELRYAKKGAPVDRKATPTKESASETDRETVETEQAEKLAKADQGVLVVRCEISPEAAKKQAFDKLLVSNGIAWQEDRDQSGSGEGGQIDNLAGRANDAKQKQQTAQVPRARRSAQAGDVDVVYVEASADQIGSTLAGLAAQSDEFPSVSVKPARGEPAQQVFEQYNRRGPAQPQFAQKGARNSPQADSSAVLGRAQRIQMPGSGAKSEEAGQRQLREQVLPQQSLQNNARQERVLFVLRVAGGANQAPSLAAQEKAGVQKDQAISIAKAFLKKEALSEQYDTAEPAKVTESPQCWDVFFGRAAGRDADPAFGQVRVDKASGKPAWIPQK